MYAAEGPQRRFASRLSPPSPLMCSPLSSHGRHSLCSKASSTRVLTGTWHRRPGELSSRAQVTVWPPGFAVGFSVLPLGPMMRPSSQAWYLVYGSGHAHQRGSLTTCVRASNCRQGACQYEPQYKRHRSACSCPAHGQNSCELAHLARGCTT